LHGRIGNRLPGSMVITIPLLPISIAIRIWPLPFALSLTITPAKTTKTRSISTLAE
jgi:hypothetical protein